MYKVIIDYNPSKTDNDLVSEELFLSHKDIIGEKDKTCSFFLKNDVGEIFGGMQVFFDTESVYIDKLWIKETFRKQGYGKKLLEAGENEAIKNGCVFSTTDTWDFQAEDFYLKNGYHRIGEIKNYWRHHSRIFLRKNLKI